MSQIESGQSDRITNISEHPRYKYFGEKVTSPTRMMPITQIERLGNNVLPCWEKVKLVGFLGVTAGIIIYNQIPSKFWKVIFNR